MDDKMKVISTTNFIVDTMPDAMPKVMQNGNDNVMIPNYGTVNLTVNQQMANMPVFGGRIYVPSHVDREYYNIFVIDCEKFENPYFNVPRERALIECMSNETKNQFFGWDNNNTPEIKRRILTLPSLFMAENNQYGNADDGQNVIFGFVTDFKIYEKDVKVYYYGYSLKISQKRLNELLKELQLYGDNNFNEMNRTHWSIKRCDLIQELNEAGFQIPIFGV